MCRVAKPESEFYTEPDSPGGLCWYCKPCKKARTNAYRANNREHYNASNRRAYHMRKKLNEIRRIQAEA